MSGIDVKDTLAQFDGTWGDTEAAGGSGGLPPDGNYEARVDRFDFEVSQKSGSMQLKTELVIRGGEHDGKRVRTWHDLQDVEKLKWLKGHLEAMGLKLDKLSELSDRLPEVLDVPVAIRIKTSGQYTNVYVNERLGDPVSKSELPDAGAAAERVATTQKSDEDDIPF